ncbi:MAG: methyl-accepting chemotaxis protein [Desulfosarcinaceae bacterium]|nr:methyl-accepting chemotaxis protein [Desulfosarcinaceae bacterium]
MRLKAKLTLGVVAIAIFIMLSTITVVYLVLNQQNRQSVNAGLTKSLNIARDDLVKRQAKIIKDSYQMVTANKIDTSVGFLTEYSNMGMSTLRGSYVEIASALKQQLVAGDLWQSAVYAVDGQLMAYVRDIGGQRVSAGFLHIDKEKAQTTFYDAEAGADEPLSDVEWSESGQARLTDIAARLSGSLSTAPTAVMGHQDETLHIRCTTPLMGSRYNKETDGMENILVGVVVSHQRLDAEFVQELAALTGSEINLYLANGALAAGSMAAYGNLQMDTAAQPAAANELVGQSPLFASVQVDEAGYYQATLTLSGAGQPAGWLAALAPEAVVTGNTHQMIGLLGVVYLVCLVIVLPIATLFAGAFAKAANIVVAGLKDIAEGEGDLTMRLSLNNRDEMGDLARWFNIFIEKLHKLVTDIAANAGHLTTRSSELTDLSTQMDRGARVVSDQSQTVAKASDEMRANITAIAGAMEQSSVNLSTVAAAAEEMTATIGDIARNAANANDVTQKAVDQVRNSTQRVNELGDAALRIGKVTETITEISEQTNLLALNATIEAARAGDAGKGFAVVANEIKELARQTAAATTEIKGQIDGIQATSQGTIRDIEGITQVIDEVNAIVSTIASAVEEQSATTSEIAGNVAQASQGIEEVNAMATQSTTVVAQVTDSLGEVDHTTSNMSGRSREVRSGTEGLSRMAEQLNALVGRFQI